MLRGGRRLLELLQDPDPSTRMVGYVFLAIILTCALGIAVLLFFARNKPNEPVDDAPPDRR